MTNREKYLDEILAALPWGKFNGEIDYCQNNECASCDFETKRRACRKEAMDWLQAEADMEPKKEPEIDWSKVSVDTPIYVRDREDQEWRPRYFAKYEDGLVHTWNGGTTSWSTNGSTMCWNYARLAKEDDEA